MTTTENENTTPEVDQNIRIMPGTGHNFPKDENGKPVFRPATKAEALAHNGTQLKAVEATVASIQRTQLKTPWMSDWDRGARIGVFYLAVLFGCLGLAVLYRILTAVFS